MLAAFLSGSCNGFEVLLFQYVTSLLLCLPAWAVIQRYLMPCLYRFVSWHSVVQQMQPYHTTTDIYVGLDHFILQNTPRPGQEAQVCHVILQIENVLDMMTLTSSLTTNSYRRVSSGQASSCHSEPKGWGPLRLYLITLCIAICTSVHSDSHYSSCRSHLKEAPASPTLDAVHLYMFKRLGSGAWSAIGFAATSAR
jgi:hypothetical protein